VLYDQLGLSYLLRGIPSPENKIISGRKYMFHLAMKIDELEEEYGFTACSGSGHG
jgi:hypothetical protein